MLAYVPPKDLACDDLGLTLFHSTATSLRQPENNTVYVTGQPRSAADENLIRFNIFHAPSRSGEAWWRHPSSGAQELAFDPSFLAIHKTDLGTFMIPFSFVGARRGRRRNGQPLIIAAKNRYRRLFFQRLVMALVDKIFIRSSDSARCRFANSRSKRWQQPYCTC